MAATPKPINPHIAKILHRKKIDDSKAKIREEKDKGGHGEKHLSPQQSESYSRQRQEYKMKHASKKAKKHSKEDMQKAHKHMKEHGG